MQRIKNAPRVELLAPVGKWDVLEAVIAAGADAVYLGGKKYNMRLHRRDFNFTRDELRDAVRYAHEHRVKVYVTVNNLLTNTEISELPDYLLFLQDIAADALIVQDLGVVRLARKLGLTVPLHASVMMNAHNREGLEFLLEMGVSRAILSRELTLAEIRLLHEQVPIELEYFAHGDMCFAHGSQCYHSGMLFGESSNRGRCLKPCRWPYELVDRDRGTTLPVQAPGPYFLAVKDMCLLPFLPEVIEAGICSLKIEGRMRSAEYLSPLIAFYRRALDRYYADPSGYSFDWEEFKELEAMRVRDLSPLYAFGNPGSASVGYTGEREPRFFSNAVPEPVIEAKDLPNNPLPLPGKENRGQEKPLLAVKAGSKAAALAALENGADVIYTSGESFRSQGKPWSMEDYRELIIRGKEKGRPVIIGTPRITMPGNMAGICLLLERIQQLEADGILVTNLGTVYAASQITELPLYADYSCNIANGLAAELLREYGVVRFTASLELCYEELVAMLDGFPLPLEAVIHGTLPTMVSDHCLPAALLEGSTKYRICGGRCREARYGLRDAAGLVHPLEIDHHCRNHIFLANELALLPYLRSFYGAGFRSLRLEIPTYTPEETGAVTRIYRAGLDRLWEDPDNFTCSEDEWDELLKARRAIFGTGPYTRGIRVKQATEPVAQK
ncbi:MAG TPA: U32 family peptidase [Syntrophomonadaceae bacterium]|nr:U32 family peptidase [Syntrophomonadaceae bacterium]